MLTIISNTATDVLGIRTDLCTVCIGGDRMRSTYYPGVFMFFKAGSTILQCMAAICFPDIPTCVAMTFIGC